MSNIIDARHRFQRQPEGEDDLEQWRRVADRLLEPRLGSSYAELVKFFMEERE